MASKIQQMFSKLSPKQIREFLGQLSNKEALQILDDWSLWAMPHQQWPEGNWRRWACRAGRGSGKSYMGSKWVNEIAEDKNNIQGGEIGIIARTHTDARQTCVEGPSGILKTAKSNFMPIWEPGKGILTWPNGVRGRIFSADKPESLRGPNFSFVWADEVCFWPGVEKTWWESIEPALRKGIARALITTTPLPDKFLRNLEELDDSVVTRASTYDNKFLKKEVLGVFEKHYKGTRRGRQELYGEFLDDNPGALWNYKLINEQRLDPDYFDYDKITRIVVAIDPAVTSHEGSDESGIIVAGMDYEKNGYILEDRSVKGKPEEVCAAAIEAYHDWQANYVVAEVNNGGDWIESTLKLIDHRVAYKDVRAKKGKLLRAEPVATAYERRMIFHVGQFPTLEQQQTEWEPGKPSPDHLDAAVYALTELVVGEEPPRNNKQIGRAMRNLAVKWR
jgi:phage terminase large subunit-like protein